MGIRLHYSYQCKSNEHLTLVLLNPDIPYLCKQCRSRSVGFWRSQLIWTCTVCHQVCEFIAKVRIQQSDWLKIRSGCGILIYSARQGLMLSMMGKNIFLNFFLGKISLNCHLLNLPRWEVKAKKRNKNMKWKYPTTIKWRADNCVKNCQNLPISNPKQIFTNINAHTKTDVNPSTFTKVIFWKQNYGQTYNWWTYQTDGQKDGHSNIQHENLIPHHYIKRKIIFTCKPLLSWARGISWSMCGLSKLCQGNLVWNCIY